MLTWRRCIPTKEIFGVTVPDLCHSSKHATRSHIPPEVGVNEYVKLVNTACVPNTDMRMV